MKANDAYVKTILTVIATCLVWMCLRDISFVDRAFAGRLGKNDIVDVRIRGIDEAPHLRWEAIKVEIQK